MVLTVCSLGRCLLVRALASNNPSYLAETSPLSPLAPAPLQSCARVELDHPMSDITRYPCSSYRPVEVQLARLNALSGLELSCPVSVLSNRDWEEAG